MLVAFFSFPFPVAAYPLEPPWGCRQCLAYCAPSASGDCSLSLLRARPLVDVEFRCGWENRMGAAEQAASPKRLHRGIRKQPRCPRSSSGCSSWCLRKLSSVATKTRVMG